MPEPIWSASCDGTKSDYRVTITESADDAARAALRAGGRRRAGRDRAGEPVDGRSHRRRPAAPARASCTRAPSAGCSSTSARGGIRPPRPRSVTPWPSATSTTTCSSRGATHDELFHRTISEFLYEWSRSNRARRARSCWWRRRSRPVATSCATCSCATASPTCSRPSDSPEGQDAPPRDRTGRHIRARRPPARRSHSRRPDELRARSRVRREHRARAAPRLRRRHRRRRARRVSPPPCTPRPKASTRS